VSKRELPRCSVERCTRRAGAIIGGTLFCGQHALKKMQERSRREARCAGSAIPGKADQLQPS
jgi:hypothetical protein